MPYVAYAPSHMLHTEIRVTYGYTQITYRLHIEHIQLTSTYDLHTATYELHTNYM